jgi:hypothetical protein
MNHTPTAQRVPDDIAGLHRLPTAPVEPSPATTAELRGDATAALHTLMEVTELYRWDAVTETEMDAASAAWTRAQDRYTRRLIAAHYAGEDEL